MNAHHSAYAAARISTGDLHEQLTDWLEQRMTRTGLRPLDDLRARIRFDDTRERFHAAEDRRSVRNVSIIASDSFPYPFGIKDHKSGQTCSGKLFDPALLDAETAHAWLVSIGKRRPHDHTPAAPLDPARIEHEQREREAQQRRIEAERAHRRQREQRRHARTHDTIKTVLNTVRPGSSLYLSGKDLPDAALKSDVWPKSIQDPDGTWTLHYLTGAAIITMIDFDGVIWNLQALFDEPQVLLDGRNKDFLPGRKAGLFHRIDGPNPAALLICEGYATGLSLQLMTECPVLVAFDAGNLAPVALAAHQQYPDARIIIAGDNDREKTAAPGRDANTGRVAAYRAARPIGAEVLLPDFAPGDAGTDWDDWRRLYWGGDRWEI